jgi:hypothetical protein
MSVPDNDMKLGSKVLKHIFWFIAGLASVFAGILLLGLFGAPALSGKASLQQVRFVALLPMLIPIVLSIVFWKKSKAFAFGVAIWVIGLVIVLLNK